MSVSPHHRSAHPFFRQAAFFMIGFGCLLIAGTVLSSVVQAPVHHRQEVYVRPTFEVQPVYALPVSATANMTCSHPLEALVRFHHGFLQITNNSYYPWHNVQIVNGDMFSPETHTSGCALIMPYQTYEVPVKPVALTTSINGSYHQSFSFRWECRTNHGNSLWCGYLVR